MQTDVTSVLCVSVYFSLCNYLGTFFLEFWKREQSAIQFRWNLMSFKEEEV